MIQIEHQYKNIINNKYVRVLDIFNCGRFDMRAVEYVRLMDFKEFIKPLYVFEKSYKLIKPKNYE